MSKLKVGDYSRLCIELFYSDKTFKEALCDVCPEVYGLESIIGQKGFEEIAPIEVENSNINSTINVYYFLKSSKGAYSNPAEYINEESRKYFVINKIEPPKSQIKMINGIYEENTKREYKNIIIDSECGIGIHLKIYPPKYNPAKDTFNSPGKNTFKKELDRIRSEEQIAEEK